MNSRGVSSSVLFDMLSSGQTVELGALKASPPLALEGHVVLRMEKSILASVVEARRAGDG